MVIVYRWQECLSAWVLCQSTFPNENHVTEILKWALYCRLLIIEDCNKNPYKNDADQVGKPFVSVVWHWNETYFILVLYRNSGIWCTNGDKLLHWNIDGIFMQKCQNNKTIKIKQYETDWLFQCDAKLKRPHLPQCFLWLLFSIPVDLS